MNARDRWRAILLMEGLALQMTDNYPGELAIEQTRLSDELIRRSGLYDRWVDAGQPLGKAAILALFVDPRLASFDLD